MQIQKMLDGYLVAPLKIEHPETKLPIIFSANTSIKINVETGVAWIRTYQVELTRHKYSLIN